MISFFFGCYVTHTYTFIYIQYINKNAFVVLMYYIKVIRFALQPGNKGVVYVHTSCIILPLSHPVHFDTEDGGNILLRSGFIAQEYRTSQRRIH